jgi:hypothetical protein
MARLALDSEAAVLARVGRIDRSSREITSRLDAICTHVARDHPRDERLDLAVGIGVHLIDLGRFAYT